MSYEKILEALAHELRRQMLSLLRDRPRSVGELAEVLPVSQPAVSQHLKILKQAGLVRLERDGTRHIYHLEPKGLDPLRSYVASFWDDPLEAYRRSFRNGARATKGDGASRHVPPDDGKKRR